MRNTFTTMEILNFIKTNEVIYKGQKLDDRFEPVFVKNSGFNLDKSDSYGSSDTNKLATSKAVVDLRTYLENYTDSSAGGSDSYTDQQITALKNEILGGASSAYDTLLEIQNELESNDTDIGSILTALDTKLNKAGGIMTGQIAIDNVAEAIHMHNGSNGDVTMRMGTDGGHAWDILYQGTTSGDLGNEIGFKSEETGRYLKFDHAGNLKLEEFDGSTSFFYNSKNRPIVDSIIDDSSIHIASARAVKTLNDNKLEKTSTAVDSQLLDGKDSTEFLESGSMKDQLVSSNEIQLHDGVNSTSIRFNSATKSLQFSYA